MIIQMCGRGGVVLLPNSESPMLKGLRGFATRKGYCPLSTLRVEKVGRLRPKLPPTFYEKMDQKFLVHRRLAAHSIAREKAETR